MAATATRGDISASDQKLGFSYQVGKLIPCVPTVVIDVITGYAFLTFEQSVYEAMNRIIEEWPSNGTVYTIFRDDNLKSHLTFSKPWHKTKQNVSIPRPEFTLKLGRTYTDRGSARNPRGAIIGHGSLERRMKPSEFIQREGIGTT